jgi:hypothetical protein
MQGQIKKQKHWNKAKLLTSGLNESGSQPKPKFIVLPVFRKGDVSVV